MRYGARLPANAGLFLAAALLSSPPAAAQDPGPAESQSDTFTIGAGAGYAPSYDGSDDYRVIPFAALRGRVSGFSFATRGTQLNVDFIPQPAGSRVDVQLGGIAGVRLNRTGSIRDVQVRALGELDEAIELGGFVGISKTGVITSDYDSITARVSYVHDVAGAHGSYVIQPAIEYGTPLSERAYVGFSASADIVGGGYARYYFDISPAGAAASGLPAYAAADGGIKDVSFTLLASHALTGDLRRGLSVVAIGRYARLLGEFRRSPIVAIAGDADQWMGGVGLAYTF